MSATTMTALRVGFAARVFLRLPREEDGAWCLDQFDRPGPGDTQATSTEEAEKMLQKALGEVLDVWPGAVILDARAFKFEIDSDFIVQAIESYTHTELIGEVDDRDAADMNGKKLDNPKWEKVEKIKLSTAFDDERSNIYGDTVDVEVGKSLPAASPDYIDVFPRR